ncbi:hypothetical protein LWI29_016269 [Acer saccharum]|uniref:Uncharacterized protein n=1 Tax=Acer saccharum TaxID=4024 RepID=A0AA39T042_ACESA|nr:hypothetical protein LWI29_016269 [Acer saccharum]
MKRICRQHGISRWPSRKINKVNRSLTKLKRVIESVQVADGTFGLTTLATSPLPVAVGSISWPSGLNGSNQHPANESAPVKDPLVSSIHEPCFEVGGSPELVFQPAGELNLTAAFSVPEALVTTEPQESFGGMLVEDAGSSKDLRNLCPAVADAIVDERFADISWTNAPCADLFSPKQAVASLTQKMSHVHAKMQEMKSVMIKATFREDIIRFRISLSTGILELKEEVAKRLRLKLEVGTFDIKYLDDDQEWVLIACDADIQECLDISRSSSSSSSSARNIIRLSIHEVTANLGSSCESTAEL